MSQSENTPCANPKLCGVQTHRPGTVALCMNQRPGTPNSSFDKLGKFPPLNMPGPSTPVRKSDSVSESQEAKTSEILDKVSKGETVEVVMAGSGEPGVDYQRILVINAHGDKDNLYGTVDNPVTAKVVTKDGLEMYAEETGGNVHYTFPNGYQRSGEFRVVDAEGNEIADQITSNDYDQLSFTATQADLAGYSGNVDPHSVLSDKDLTHDAILNVVKKGAPDTTPFLNERGEAALNDALNSGKGEVVLETTEDGIQKSILLNEYGNKVDDLYWITENPLRAKIKTASGVESFGTIEMRKEYTFKDGVTVEGWVRPNDKNGWDNSKDITSGEYEVLRQTAGLAKTLGDVKNVDRDGKLGVVNRNREVVRKVMDQVK